MKYKVTFEEMFNGQWMNDYYSNNGIGFSYNEALDIKNDLECNGEGSIPIRNVKIEEI